MWRVTLSSSCSPILSSAPHPSPDNHFSSTIFSLQMFASQFTLASVVSSIIYLNPQMHTRQFAPHLIPLTILILAITFTFPAAAVSSSKCLLPSNAHLTSLFYALHSHLSKSWKNILWILILIQVLAITFTFPVSSSKCLLPFNAHLT